MPRNIGSMTDHELLEELVLQGRRAERANVIRNCLIAALLLVIVILALVYIPKIMAPIGQLSESMDQVRIAAEQAQALLDNFDEETVERFKETMESLNETSQQTRVLMQKLKESGLDKLASSVEELNNALNGFLKFFQR